MDLTKAPTTTWEDHQIDGKYHKNKKWNENQITNAKFIGILPTPTLIYTASDAATAMYPRLR